MPDPTPSRPSAQLSTTARLSLGREAVAIPTRDQLQFQLDHALARDAVHAALDVRSLMDGLRTRGMEPIALHSAALDRKTYLRRPDLGRMLHPDSVEVLRSAGKPCAPHLDSEMWEEQIPTSARIVFILADGLSALALERHALPLLDATLGLLDPGPWTLIPVVTHARVAIGDEIGQLLGAQITVMMIGERPGLSSPDSLGVYITWNPCPGRTDAERNCISNIRGDAGLSYAEAAQRIAHYIGEASRLKATGTALKDPITQPSAPALPGQSLGNEDRRP